MKNIFSNDFKAIKNPEAEAPGFLKILVYIKDRESTWSITECENLGPIGPLNIFRVRRGPI